jgi:hypothetical protein
MIELYVVLIKALGIPLETICMHYILENWTLYIITSHAPKF